MVPALSEMEPVDFIDPLGTMTPGRRMRVVFVTALRKHLNKVSVNIQQRNEKRDRIDTRVSPTTNSVILRKTNSVILNKLAIKRVALD